MSQSLTDELCSVIEYIDDEPPWKKCGSIVVIQLILPGFRLSPE
jgi:hypothetical protein